MNLDAERDRLLALAEKATPGPWKWLIKYKGLSGADQEEVLTYLPHENMWLSDGEHMEFNAALIAAAPDMSTLIRAQAAEIELLRALRDEMVRFVSEHAGTREAAATEFWLRKIPVAGAPQQQPESSMSREQFREVVRRLRPDISDRQFRALWARSIFARYARKEEK